ncbi:hypothetical protein ABMA27_011747 [Loxostege sticticalis]|uniref:3CxxC-type domain-containing protein n=1 Tax=Loxostege sticticalis TaxID=481309 RepID=A0ABR3IHD0_LOXSC
MPTASLQTRPRFGEYRCSCGRYWESRLSWARSYQICKRCRKPVYPTNQRELRQSDLTQSQGKENRPEHQKEFCQMCQQLGHYCGTNSNNVKSRRKH